MEMIGKKDTIFALPVIQNHQEFLFAKISISKLVMITKYTERLIVNFDEKNLPVYNPDIQRTIEKSRVEKISSVVRRDNTEFTDLMAIFSSIPDCKNF